MESCWPVSPHALESVVVVMVTSWKEESLSSTRGNLRPRRESRLIICDDIVLSLNIKVILSNLN